MQSSIDPTAQGRSGENCDLPYLLDCLARSERRILHIIERTADEHSVEALSRVMDDLVSIRLCLERPRDNDKRSAPRHHQRSIAELKRADGSNIEVAVHDISIGGALVESDKTFDLKERLTVYLTDMTEGISAEARSVADGFVHLAFVDLPPASLLSLAKHLDRRYQRY